jgi:hypothetical protein
MKLSNKILLAFFGFLFLYMTAAFTEIRLTGTLNVINDSNSKAETVDLSGIHYLVVNDPHRNIRVVGSDRSQLQVRSLTGDLLKKLQYRISGDTLVLSGLESDHNDIRTIRISVYVPKDGLKGLLVNAADVEARGLELERLHIIQNTGRIWMSNSQISRIDLQLSDKSFLDISGTDIDSLSAEVDRSEAHVNSLVGFVRGSITNDSFLQLSGIREIQMKKDESSKLNMF